MSPLNEGTGRHTLAALSELARTSVRSPTTTQLDRGLAAVRARVAQDKERRRAARRRTWYRVALAGAVTAVAASWMIAVRLQAPGSPAALAYQIEGGSVTEGGYLRESRNSGIKLSFSEGTEFVLAPGTRSRLRSVDASGARIAIEHGTAAFDITPAPKGERRWQVEVGPFLVTVKGTVFSVSWNPATERFELKLRRGRVTVNGPVTGGEIALHTGQRLVVDLPKGQTVISEHKADPWLESSSAAEPPEPETGADNPAPESTKPAPQPKRAAGMSPAGPANGERRWSQALAAGHLDRILADAERAGLKQTLEKASSEDLLALADAARYRRRMDLAREALLAERRRFSDSPRALDAAFLLGRVEETSDRGLARAIEWYDEYLTRAPAGTYASEALGRKMTLTRKLQGVSDARPVAAEYLRRFPNGIYAGPARAFLRAP